MTCVKMALPASKMEEMIEKDSARIGRSRVVDQSTSRPNWRMNVRVNEMKCNGY